MTKEKVSLVWHIRMIAGGVAMNILLSGIFVIFEHDFLGWEPSLIRNIIVSTLILILVSFLIAKRSKGSVVDGALIGYIHALIGIIGKNVLPKIWTELGVKGVLVVLLFSPLPIVAVGALSAAVGYNLRVKKNKTK